MTEDECDAEIARQRLAEIAVDPSALISDEELERRLADLTSTTS
jgi:hypothetical protein